MAKETIRVAAYARTSSAQQHTCQTQLALCRDLIDDRGWKLTHQLRDDALKGKNPDRPGYQRLLDLVKEKRIDVLVMWKRDRAFRSLTEASSTQAPQINAASA
jgi:site-specific DNA recombinase